MSHSYFSSFCFYFTFFFLRSSPRDIFYNLPYLIRIHCSPRSILPQYSTELQNSLNCKPFKTRKETRWKNCYKLAKNHVFYNKDSTTALYCKDIIDRSWWPGRVHRYFWERFQSWAFIFSQSPTFYFGWIVRFI